MSWILSLLFSTETLKKAIQARNEVLHVEIITMDLFTEQYRRFLLSKGPRAVPPLTDLDRKANNVTQFN